MNKFIFTAAALLLASPAFAQDSVIRIIGDDGSVQELDLATPRPRLDPIVDGAPRDVEPEVTVEAPVAQPSEEALKAPAAEVVEEVKTVIEPKAEPAPKAATKAKPKAKAVKAKKQVKSMIKPGRKPRRYDAPIEKAVQRPAGTLISREDALAIALEDAPPAMRVVAVPRIYQGVQVFSVTFHTENGSVERVVDRVTGEILP